MLKGARERERERQRRIRRRRTKRVRRGGEGERDQACIIIAYIRTINFQIATTSFL